MRKGVAAAALMLTALAASQARAETVADFYRGKQIIVGDGPGGGYDVYARLVGATSAATFDVSPMGADDVVAALERIEKASPQLLDYLKKLFAERKG